LSFLSAANWVVNQALLQGLLQ